MLGYQAHREVFLWVETRDAQQVTLDYWLAGRPETKKTLEHTNPAATPTPAGRSRRSAPACWRWAPPTTTR
jgi:hypothetical protein